MDAETWFDAKEAEALGFVDRVVAESASACVTPDVLARYRNAPEGIAANAGEPAPNIAEDASDEEKPETGAVEGAAGAAARVVCVQGQFLTYNNKE